MAAGRHVSDRHSTQRFKCVPDSDAACCLPPGHHGNRSTLLPSHHGNRSTLPHHSVAILPPSPHAQAKASPCPLKSRLQASWLAPLWTLSSPHVATAAVHQQNVARRPALSPPRLHSRVYSLPTLRAGLRPGESHSPPQGPHSPPQITQPSTGSHSPHMGSHSPYRGSHCPPGVTQPPQGHTAPMRSHSPHRGSHCPPGVTQPPWGRTAPVRSHCPPGVTQPPQGHTAPTGSHSPHGVTLPL